MALITMPISTYYVLYNRRIFRYVRPCLERLEREDTLEAQPVEYENHAVIVGYSRLTGELADVLRASVDEVVFVEDRAEYVDELAEADDGFIFGNARHGDVRQEANVSGADVVVSAAERVDVNRRQSKTPRKRCRSSRRERKTTLRYWPTAARTTSSWDADSWGGTAGPARDARRPQVFDRRIEELNDRARDGVPRRTDSASRDGETDV